MSSCVFVVLSDPFSMQISLFFLSIVHRDLSKNQISTVEAIDFANFTSLRRLDLAENSLRMLDNNTFGEIKSLEKVKLSLNLIVHIFQGAFDGLPQLKQL